MHKSPDVGLSEGGTWRGTLLDWVAVSAFALFAWYINQLVPLVSALLWALVLGALVANTIATRVSVASWAAVGKLMLRLGIVGLGLQLSISEIAATGWAGILIIVSTVAITYLSTLYVGRKLGLEHDLVTLIAAGFAVCGAAAIAAVQDAVKAKERDVAAALALVTLFGTAMIVLIPLATTWFGLSDVQGAVWAGASIHEVAQVVAAAASIGVVMIPVASVIKLGRVVLLAPVYMHAAKTRTVSDGAPVSIVPWFVTGFIAMFLLRWTGWLDPAVIDTSKPITTFLLAGGMFGLGLGFRLRDLLKMSFHAFTLAIFATVLAATISGVQVFLFM